MMIRFSLATLLIAAVACGATGCVSLGPDVVFEGAIAEVAGDRVYVVSTEPPDVRIGQVVSIYQRIDVPAIDPYQPPWHRLEPVAKGSIEEVTPQGAWVRIQSGVVAPSGETELRDVSE